MSEQFILRGAIDQIHPLRDITRKRAESSGLFPRRVRLSPRVAAWRRSEIEEWIADPAAWAQKAKSVA
jgi:Prophage CP4-57 regulatory protein (AlpA)